MEECVNCGSPVGHFEKSITYCNGQVDYEIYDMCTICGALQKGNIKTVKLPKDWKSPIENGSIRRKNNQK